MIPLVNSCVSQFFRLVGRRFFSKQTATTIKVIQARRLDPKRYLSAHLNDLVIALVAAEDRRFFNHCGVDFRGIVRAAFAYILKRNIQGASTITQQLVRVVVNDYRFSFQRKLKEICIAAEVDSIIDKRSQAELYLLIGYYGWRMNGLTAAKERLSISFPCSTAQAAQLVARLKYPEPKNFSINQTKKIDCRAAHILNLINENPHGF